jgi:molybdate transport system substrate-binding protein
MFRTVLKLICKTSVICLAICACQGTVQARELLVSAAVSLEQVLTPLAAEFEQANRGDRIRFNFASSGELARQIEQGAAGDVFISASEAEVHSLNKQNLLIANSAKVIASNRLVVIVPSNTACLKDLHQLSKLSRIAIGNPELVPAGHYAKQALDKDGLYNNLKSAQKLVLAESARQILTYVEGGNVDAGIVYSTDARTARHSQVCIEIPAQNTDHIVYIAAAIASAKERTLGQRFMNYITSASARKLFQAHGFLPPS